LAGQCGTTVDTRSRCGCCRGHPAAGLQPVSSRGGIQVARQRIQVGFSHVGQIVTIEPGDTTLRVIDQHGELLSTVPRKGIGEISRFKAYGSKYSQ
jgi:hypothetical protein